MAQSSLDDVGAAIHFAPVKMPSFRWLLGPAGRRPAMAPAMAPAMPRLAGGAGRGAAPPPPFEPHKENSMKHNTTGIAVVSSPTISRQRHPEFTARRCLAAGWVAAMMGSAMAADVNFMAVVKSQSFKQMGPDLVALRNSEGSEDEMPLTFEGFIEGAAVDSLVSGTVQLPGGTTHPITRGRPGDFGLRQEYAAEALLDLDAARPNGTY